MSLFVQDVPQLVSVVVARKGPCWETLFQVPVDLVVDLVDLEGQKRC